MNDDLKIAFDEYFETIKKTRPNYKACYNSFLEYCNKHPNNGLKRLFADITMFEIEQACKKYFLSSKRAKSLEAIQRFLSAMDMFYAEYLVPHKIECETLKEGCRNQEVIKRICQSLNQELNQKIFLPLEDDEIKKAEKLINKLNTDNFFQLGQKIIFLLLLKYGFKVQMVINLKVDAYNVQNHILRINNAEDAGIMLRIPDDLAEDLEKYLEMHPFPKREYLFTITNGKKLNSGSILQTVKDWAIRCNIENFTPTSLALRGIANMISRNLSFCEISKLTGFELQKIADVAEYLLEDKDVSQIINDKLNN